MKKIYYFRPELREHFFLYYSWIAAAKKSGFDITMFTAIDLTKVKSQLVEYKKIKKLPNVKIIITPHQKLNSLFAVAYILACCIRNKNVSLIAKKVNLNALQLVKKIFPKRFSYKIELEGDLKSEIEYLSKYPYEDGFYEVLVTQLKNKLSKEKEEFKKSDGLVVLSSYLKQQLVERYNFIKERDVNVISTGFIKDRMKFDAVTRENCRKNLGILPDQKCFIYSGNVFYSWQNIKETLMFFKYYNENFDSKSLFMLIVRREDHVLAKKFINSVGVNSDKIILKSVENDDIEAFYNAADIGILLRKNEVMNIVSSPGKIGEYAACGLPILTTKYLGDYSDIFIGRKEVKQLEKTDEFELLSLAAESLFKISKDERACFSKWSNDTLSSDAHVLKFVSAF